MASTDNESFYKELSAIEGLSQEDLEEIKNYVETKGETKAPALKEAEKARKLAELQKEGADSDNTDLRFLLNDMNLAEKLKIAMFGNAACRSLLINDPNKMIQLAVLKNPKMQFTEVEEFSKNKNLSDLVLRAISDNKTWAKEYSIKHNLVFNPKTPPDISLKWLRYLRKNDLKKAAKSKDIPNLIAVSAKKRLVEMEKKR
ncbi:MAG: hypothetical protein D6719_06455 [Candidatus Dadabacteria bacterium]|nr:MAG: hypothetical protein D6719_06455 [Candidatus Dadabacteria bacterium]